MWYSLTFCRNDREVHKRTAWTCESREHSGDIQEAADFIADLNIENDGSQKMLMIKAVKQRDMQTNANDSTRMVSAIRHPFISINAFALQTDVNENCSLSIPIYIGKQNASFLANI